MFRIRSPFHYGKNLGIAVIFFTKMIDDSFKMVYMIQGYITLSGVREKGEHYELPARL